MKITITLSPAEVKAMKAYLKATSHDINPKITKEDIKREVVCFVDQALNSGALGDYVNNNL